VTRNVFIALLIVVPTALFAQSDRETVEVAAVSISRQLGLAQAQDLLLKRNLSVLASHEQLAVSEALRLIAGYKPNPVLQIGAEQYPVHSPVPGSVPRLFSTNSDAGAEPTYTAQVMKIFERGGKREYRMGQADAVVEASRYQILDTFRTQLYQLRQAFTAAILSRENLRLAETSNREYQQTQELTAIRVKTGDMAMMELFRARAGRLPFQQAILDARNAYEQAGKDILNLLNVTVADSGGLRADTPTRVVQVNAHQDLLDGTDPGDMRFLTTLDITDSFTDRILPGDLSSWKAVALANRPDVLAARANVRAADQALALAGAQRKRDIAVGVEYQRVGNDSAVGMIAQIPLFLYNNQKAAIVQATAQHRLAEAQERQAEMQALTDVEKANQAYISAKNLLALYSSENLIQVENLRLTAEYSYKHGDTSLFEYLDTARTARQAAIAANQARAAYQLSLWQMENAVGTGFDPATVLRH
jgi:cobalt-zinc-cadmium efflux system outer membrane protein